jgi:hypothetical protein
MGVEAIDQTIFPSILGKTKVFYWPRSSLTLTVSVMVYIYLLLRLQCTSWYILTYCSIDRFSPGIYLPIVALTVSGNRSNNISLDIGKDKSVLLTSIFDLGQYSTLVFPNPPGTIFDLLPALPLNNLLTYFNIDSFSHGTYLPIVTITVYVIVYTYIL